VDPSAYLLSRELMTEQVYPVPTRVEPTEARTTPVVFEDWKVADGWIEAPWIKAGYGERKVLGIDCEMVSPPNLVIWMVD
jgi:RNA exonuclease 1